MNLAREYDKWHEHVFDSSPEHPDESSPWYNLVLEHLAPMEGKWILEVACGRGGFIQFLASRGASVCGADFSASALRIAQQKVHRGGASCAQATLAQADAQHLPYADSSFDLVISCETIEHIVDPLAAVREMARVCRTKPNYANLMGFYQLYATLRNRENRADFTQPLDRCFVFFQVRRFLRKAGWDILDSDGVVHQIPTPRRNPLLLRFVESNRSARRWLSPLALHYLLIGRKRAPA
jgi:ubiquinone/menaquinone biosynthesis C-methylase UbiE